MVSGQVSKSATDNLGLVGPRPPTLPVGPWPQARASFVTSYSVVPELCDDRLAPVQSRTPDEVAG